MTGQVEQLFTRYRDFGDRYVRAIGGIVQNSDKDGQIQYTDEDLAGWAECGALAVEELLQLLEQTKAYLLENRAAAPQYTQPPWEEPTAQPKETL